MVGGNVIGKPFSVRTARKAKACASSASRRPADRIGGLDRRRREPLAPACASRSDCARRRRRRSRLAAAPADAARRARPLRRSAPTASRRRPATEKSGRPILANAKALRSSDFGGIARRTDAPARARRRPRRRVPRRGLSPSSSSGAPVRARMKSSISALPGPVSQAIGSPAVDEGDVGDAAEIEHRDRMRPRRDRAPARDERPAPAARPARRPRHRRRGNRRPPECRVARASAAPSPICTVSRARGRCSTVWPWKPTTSTSAVSMRFAVEERLHRLGVHARDEALGLARARRPRARGRSARAPAPAPGAAAPRSVVAIGPVAGRPEAAMRSPSVSISATSTPSSEVPLISPIARHSPATRQPLRLNPTPDLLHHAATATRQASRARSMSAYKSDFLHVLAERGFIHQVSEPEALDALRQRRRDHRLYRLRLHRALAACRLAAADHDAVLAAADRPPADRADGRRHHARRRPVRQGREPAHPHRRDDRREPRRHPRDLLEIPEVRRAAAATPSWPTMPTG